MTAGAGPGQGETSQVGVAGLQPGTMNTEHRGLFPCEIPSGMNLTPARLMELGLWGPWLGRGQKHFHFTMVKILLDQEPRDAQVTGEEEIHLQGGLSTQGAL